MSFCFNEEQLEYLTAAVRYRIEDETAEIEDITACHRDEWLPNAQHRLDVWKGILSELTKEG